MIKRIDIVVIVLILLVIAAMVVPMLWRVREAAARAQCHNNLKQLAMSLQIYHDVNHAYPRGTVAHTSLPPERRLSWYVDYSGYVEAGCKWLMDPEKPWDDDANRPTRAECKVSHDVNTIRYGKRVIEEMPVFLCPSNPHRIGPGAVSLTHYVGIAGVGIDAAVWPLEHPGVGLFGYDRSACWSDIKDGASTTMALIETAEDNGPWTAGGSPTVRGLDPNRPYFGESDQFTTFHRLINIAFIDGSVRHLRETVSPQVFEALTTIAGGEEIPLSED